MSQVILCRVGERPHVTRLALDEAGSCRTALQEILDGPVACFTLYGSIQLWCNRAGLVAGLMLTHHILEMFPAEPGLHAITILVEDLHRWMTKGDFLLARSDENGELADLTESDIEHCMFWLDLDLMHR